MYWRSKLLSCLQSACLRKQAMKVHQINSKRYRREEHSSAYDDDKLKAIASMKLLLLQQQFHCFEHTTAAQLLSLLLEFISLQAIVFDTVLDLNTDLQHLKTVV